MLVVSLHSPPLPRCMSHYLANKVLGHTKDESSFVTVRMVSIV